ncbi:MAG: PilZ domain-containing protein [Deltaproteobacteria bacterium]|jgi:hypothetical protein|nr:PilZ domain-containing protein [Deltaproteobacteria bacterium]MCL5880540.1 PilZ domain-containing protein [Deltaproteobacteria bacterium]MDA8304036.1 PilZ domain-containing protein [Deltaproteobacteria bacterium]
MDNLENYFYNNQEIVFRMPQKAYKGFISNIEEDYLYIILYASFTEKRVFEFNEAGYDINADINLINSSKDNTLIYQDIDSTYLFKLLVNSVVRSAGSITVKVQIPELLSRREGREFLRISTHLQFIYEEIQVKEFLDIKDEYISKPSFSTSVYGIYNLAAPKIYQPSAAAEGQEVPVNPRLEKLLVAINSKLDVILSLLNPEASIFANIKERKVSISGSGIMFSEPQDQCISNAECLKQGSVIKITMLFPTVPQFMIKAIAQVVKVEKDAGYNIACKFIAINESDRDEIIKFTLDKQRQQIKNPAS